MDSDMPVNIYKLVTGVGMSAGNGTSLRVVYVGRGAGDWRRWCTTLVSKRHMRVTPPPPTLMIMMMACTGAIKSGKLSRHERAENMYGCVLSKTPSQMADEKACSWSKTTDKHMPRCLPSFFSRVRSRSSRCM
jgi:hypothetical protein